MSRLATVIASGLIVLLWQASLAQDTARNQAIRVEIESRGTSGTPGMGDAAVDLVESVYERRDFDPAWEEPGQVESLLDAIRSSYRDGLIPADYDLDAIEQVRNDIASGRVSSAGELAAFDLMLTDSLIRLVYNLHHGKVDPETHEVTRAFGQPIGGRDPSIVIAEIIDSDELVEAVSSFAPRDRDYHRLKAQLEQHRRIAAAGGWPELPDGPTIRPGSSDPRLETLASRLAISGDLVDSDSRVAATDYGPVLQDAVRRFQARHGLEVDGLVGQATLRALSIPIEERIGQIRLNLERYRWRVKSRFEDFILVNAAGFEAYLIRQRNIVRTMTVIVGEPESMTPLFEAMLTHVVFNPTWTVPYTIASNELLPRIQQDPEYLARGRYQVVDRNGEVVDSSAVDWNTFGEGNFPFTLVQQPGPWNQLGQVKFMFPNEHSVYMHDTPDRALFSKACRAFSHGCIRVDDPVDLAEILLDGEEGWARVQIDAQIQSQETITVNLSEPLPVVVVYWTADVGEQGELRFYDDIYERDAAVLTSLDGPSLP